ncbi:MAG: exodeoxyribonuclease VII large subunit [Candidatus Hydrogenedentes bacterium]|nr:exodeoxyribonuclease VII large subunit [Candidatus Hydrogenedentota bacterium]
MAQAQQPEIWSVSQLTRRVKSLLETEISYVWVSGEISNFRVSPAGHAYFTLKDAESQVEAVMFRGKFMQVKFGPENGLEVIVHGLVTVYEKRGSYQIVCEEMQPKGMGALQLAFEKLRRKLEAEGLFDPAHKKRLPLLPKRIGIVTSPTGAAIRDILNVIQRRFANVHILLFPARVQGEAAAEEIVEGIRVLDRWGVDVMIVGRGGGSLEDLWPFNEEVVVRAVYEVTTPVISAVGHEIDFTLCDFAADVRAPTPSAAAELVVQEQENLLAQVRQLGQRLGKGLRGYLERARHRLRLARSSYVFKRPAEIARQRRQQTDELRMRLEAGLRGLVTERKVRFERALHALALLSPANQLQRMRERLAGNRVRLVQAGTSLLERLRGRLGPVLAKLHALSPLAILSRGYTLAWRLPERALVREAKQLAREDKLLLKFGSGSAVAAVETVEGTSHG